MNRLLPFRRAAHTRESAQKPDVRQPSRLQWAFWPARGARTPSWRVHNHLNALLFLFLCPIIHAQPPLAAPGPAAATPPPASAAAAAQGRWDEVLKAVDDLMWNMKLGDIADVDKVMYTSLPPQHAANPNAPGATNPLIIHAYTFIPKKLDRSKKQPLIVYIHGGVHGNFDTSESRIVRELVEQGYSVISTDYRGSTGYGRGFYEQIDYGGREVDDVFAGGQWMLGEYDFLDPKRVGIVGWSHGGLITLMNIFQHPQTYAVAYAGVPVSDLVARTLLPMWYGAE